MNLWINSHYKVRAKKFAKKFFSIIISLFHRIYEFKNLRNLWIMIHPWKKIIEEIRNRNWTQKQFAILVWKKNSEVNELIKWKRNITIQRDYILSQVLWTPEKYWINMQTDYDYEQMKLKIKEEKNKVENFEIVEDIPSNDIQEVSDTDNKQKAVMESWKDEQVDSEKESNIPEQPQNENNIKESWNVDLPKTEEISEEEKEKRREMRKVFINF